MKTFLKILSSFLLLTQICFAQWVQFGLANKHIGEIAVGSTGLFAVTSENGSVFHTTDGGANWFQILDSLGTHVAVAANGTTFMAVEDSLYRSTDGGMSWINLHMLEQINVGLSWMNIYCVAVGPNGNIFSGCWARHVDIGGTGTDDYGVVNAISTDNGTTWSWGGVWGGEAYSFREHSVITSGYWNAVTTGWAGCAISFNDGLTWTYTPLWGLRPPFVWCSNGMIMFREYLYEPWRGGGWLSLSADTCTSATKVSDITPSALLALPQGRVLVGTDTTGIYLFSDNGDSLGSRNDGLTNLNVHTLTMDNNGYVYVGTDNGVWRRLLSEIVPVELTSFTAQALDQKVILRWATATELNNNGFEIQRRVAESDFATVGFVRGEGTTTNQKQYSYIDKDLADGKYFYRLKQVDYNGTFEYSNAIEVDVRSLNDYALEQNYPNPFNPATTIGYVLKEKTTAKLILLNAIGEEVAVLVNEEQDKGFHKVDFNASNLASGVYFYRLQAGDFVQTKKMLLLK